MQTLFFCVLKRYSFLKRVNKFTKKLYEIDSCFIWLVRDYLWVLWNGLALKKWMQSFRKSFTFSPMNSRMQNCFGLCLLTFWKVCVPFIGCYYKSHEKGQVTKKACELLAKKVFVLNNLMAYIISNILVQIYSLFKARLSVDLINLFCHKLAPKIGRLDHFIKANKICPVEMKRHWFKNEWVNLHQKKSGKINSTSFQ